MSKNTDRLISLTNQLLDFQKTESDAYLLNLEQRTSQADPGNIPSFYTPKQRGVLSR